ncbi:MAG: hypothetical protein IBX62_01155 [Coriobacteriia bacterium]|nr:hypothetical protein [Coriobacteriia bacterium]
MQSHTDILLADLATLAALASAVLCGPAATAAAALTIAAGRKQPVTKLRAALLSLAAAGVVGGGAALGLFILRGTIEEASALLFAIPGAVIVSLLGALPGGLLARWLHRRFGPRRRESTSRLDAA